MSYLWNWVMSEVECALRKERGGRAIMSDILNLVEYAGLVPGIASIKMSTGSTFVRCICLIFEMLICYIKT
jgi:hypothetical protein